MLGNGKPSFGLLRVLLLPSVEDTGLMPVQSVTHNPVIWFHFVSASASSCGSRSRGWSHVLSPLSLINNLSIPRTSLFYLNNTQTRLWSQSPHPLKEHNHNKIIQKSSLISTEWIMRWCNHRQPNGMKVAGLMRCFSTDVDAEHTVLLPSVGSVLIWPSVSRTFFSNLVHVPSEKTHQIISLFPECSAMNALTSIISTWHVDKNQARSKDTCPHDLKRPLIQTWSVSDKWSPLLPLWIRLVSYPPRHRPVGTA